MHAILQMMVLSAVAAAPDLAVPKFDVQLVDGTRVSGSLAEWDAAQLVVETAAGRQTLDAAKVVSLSAQAPPSSPAKAAVWVDLVDGSQLLAAEYTAGEGRAKIVFPNRVLELPIGEVEAVRLQPVSDATALEWSRIRGRKLHSDVLVKGKTNTVAYEGAIEQVTEQKVRFLLHNESRSVRRADVFGLIYFHAAAASTAESPMTIVDAAGSRWAANSLKLGADAVEFAAPGGRTDRVGLGDIAKIDLSCGKIVYLSDLKPDVERIEPFGFTVTGKSSPAAWRSFSPAGTRISSQNRCGSTGRPSTRAWLCIAAVSWLGPCRANSAASKVWPASTTTSARWATSACKCWAMARLCWT